MTGGLSIKGLGQDKQLARTSTCRAKSMLLPSLSRLTRQSYAPSRRGQEAGALLGNLCLLFALPCVCMGQKQGRVLGPGKQPAPTNGTACMICIYIGVCPQCLELHCVVRIIPSVVAGGQRSRQLTTTAARRQTRPIRWTRGRRRPTTTTAAFRADRTEPAGFSGVWVWRVCRVWTGASIYNGKSCLDLGPLERSPSFLLPRSKPLTSSLPPSPQPLFLPPRSHPPSFTHICTGGGQRGGLASAPGSDLHAEKPPSSTHCSAPHDEHHSLLNGAAPRRG
jgi:hypothetical protein